MLRVLSLLRSPAFCATVTFLIAAASIGGALGQEARGMGLTAFIVDPGVMGRNDLESLLGNGGSTRDYAVVFAPGMPGLLNGEFDSGLLVRPSGLPWHIDTNKVAEELAATPTRPTKPFTVHVVAQVLKEIATDLGRFRNADTRWRQTPETPIPLDIVLLLRRRLQNDEGMAIGKPICDDQDPFRQLREPRQRFNDLFTEAAKLNFKLDVRILIGLNGESVPWTTADLYNVLIALGLFDKETRVSVAQLFPAQGRFGTAADFEPKRPLPLAP